VQSRPGPWKEELDDLARAFSGAFLLGVPLLFTMEMWWIGEYSDSWKLFLFLLLALVINVMLSYFAGFKEETNLWANVTQAIEAVAVGAVASTVVLVVLNRVEPGQSLDAILGKIVIQAVPLSIGASAANALLAQRQNRPGDEEEEEKQKRSPLRATMADLGANVAGGIFIGFTIAPTQEIPLLAASLGYWNAIALIALTLVATYLIVFESNFSPKQPGENLGPFQRPITETALSYVVSLALAVVALFLFDQIELGDNLYTLVTEMLVLGFPTAVGGAAGRVLL